MSNVAASARARLLNVAKAQGSDFNQVLVRFALERILYRPTQSPHADRFLLKGALLFGLAGRGRDGDRPGRWRRSVRVALRLEDRGSKQSLVLHLAAGLLSPLNVIPHVP